MRIRRTQDSTESGQTPPAPDSGALVEQEQAAQDCPPSPALARELSGATITQAIAFLREFPCPSPSR